jgi:dTDP-glucose 4,6-dehydratase
VVNFAAETHVDRSIDDPAPFVISNVNGTAVLLDACLKYGTPRFHQVSTDEVYGEYRGYPDKGFAESAPLCPSSPYAATKAASDMLALSYFRTYGLFVTVTRGANTYGERQYPEKLIPKTVTLALDGKPIPVMGDGSARRDWIFVGDHARAIECVLEKGAPGEIYNVPGETELTNIDTVKRVLSLVGADSELVRFVPGRLGHDARYLVNGEKLKDLGFSHGMTFDKGLEYTVRRYLEEYRGER